MSFSVTRWLLKLNKLLKSSWLLNVYTYCRDIRHFGVQTGSTVWRHSLAAKRTMPADANRDHETVISVPGIAHPIAYRTYSSDAHVIRQIFSRQEYEKCATDKRIQEIVDCGANIGCASIYFLNRFPTARVVAIEPDDDNFRMCVKNLAPYGERAIVVHGAVWWTSTKLELVSSSLGEEWGRQVRATQQNPGSVQAYTIDEILSMLGRSTIDLLKVDIEGAELDLFSKGDLGWLERVNNIVIELHGSACRSAFFAALAEFEYTSFEHFESTHIVNLRRKAVEQST